MAQVPVKQIITEFPFLDDRSAQEPFLYEILCEIQLYQKEGYAKGTDGFATRETIATSRNIHIPFSPARDKNIDYIIELLTTRFADYVAAIVTFDFKFDEYAKKLSIIEKEELAINIHVDELDRLRTQRDEISLSNFLDFIAKFRLFNLDKMIKRARYRKDLDRVIHKGLGKTFFTYNHFVAEKGKIEAAEEYCFHSSNYDPVKKSLNLTAFRSIVATYNELVKNRLKKFGIMNADFSDYRDTKIDYIISIFLDDLSGSLLEKDRIEIKNFKSLRECILQVDKVLDPVQIFNTDIVKFIRGNSPAARSELSTSIMKVTPEIVNEWDNQERLQREHIIKERDNAGVYFFVDGHSILSTFEASFASMKSSSLSQDSSQQKEFFKSKTELLSRAAKQILLSESAAAYIGGSQQDLQKLMRLYEEYEAFIKKLIVQQEIARQTPPPSKKGRPFYFQILSAIAGLFSFLHSKSGEEDIYETQYAQPKDSAEIRREPRKETKELYEKANLRRGPVVALSELIELKPENEMLVQRIIQELRENNMKIVVPIYNARTTLYPKRSSKLLMSDVEYLLVPPAVIKSLDTISEYINSIVGTKLKDEVIPNKGLIALEKYLRVLHRQRRASLMRKKDMREKEMKR